MLGIAGYLLTAVFSAGGAVAIFKRLRGDVNGVGRKLNGVVEKQDERQRRLILAVMMLAKDDAQREKLAELLK